MKNERSQSSSVSLRPQYNKSRQFIPMVKILLASNYAYDYKRIGKIAYKIHPSKAVIPYHSRLYPRINFILGANPKFDLKNMFEYSFLNIIYVNNDCRKFEEFSEKIKESINDLKIIFKTKEIIFIKVLATCLKYYDNKWYLA